MNSTFNKRNTSYSVIVKVLFTLVIIPLLFKIKAYRYEISLDQGMY